MANFVNRESMNKRITSLEETLDLVLDRVQAIARKLDSLEKKEPTKMTDVEFIKHHFICNLNQVDHCLDDVYDAVYTVEPRKQFGLVPADSPLYIMINGGSDLDKYNLMMDWVQRSLVRLVFVTKWIHLVTKR